MNRHWVQSHITDPYVQRAQREGYRSRAVYKLQEIDAQDHLIRPGQCIVDLGAAPGSWSQYVRYKLAHGARRAGSPLHGTVMAVDLLPMEDIPDVLFIQGDFRETEISAQLEKSLGTHPVDLVLSDMAPNLSGITSVDAAKMEYLGELTLEFAQRVLNSRGMLLIKYFQGSGYSQMIERFKSCFKSVVTRKPKASRSRSAEIFIIGKFLKPLSGTPQNPYR